MQNEDLVPPPELLFDGSTAAEQFISVGENFTREYLIGRARLKPHDRVLDVGSGNGQKARALAAYLSSEGRYDGFDIVQAGVDWCRERYARFPNFHFELAPLRSTHYESAGNAESEEYEFPYPDAVFDLVFLSSVFTHMLPNELLHYLDEIVRVLKPDGRCLTTFFLLMNDETRACLDRGTQAIDFPHAFGENRVLDKEHPHTAIAYDEDWVRRALHGAGLRVCEITYGNWPGTSDHLKALQDTVLSLKTDTSCSPRSAMAG